MPLSYRGRFLVFTEYFWTLGSMTVAWLAWVLLTSSSWSIEAWRVLTFITVVPVAITLLVSPFLLPESARWLISQRKTEEAENILRSIAAINGVALDPFKISYELEFPVAEQPSRWMDLVSSSYMLRRTIPLWVINIIIIFFNHYYFLIIRLFGPHLHFHIMVLYYTLVKRIQKGHNAHLIIVIYS